MPQPTWRLIRESLLVALTYVVAAALSLRIATEVGQVAPVTAPTGVMVAVLLIRGFHLWPGVLAGALVSQLLWSLPLIQAAGAGVLVAVSLHAVGDTAAVMFSVLLLRKVGSTRLILTNLKMFGHFLLLAVVLGPGIAAAIGVSALAVFGVVPEQNVLYTLLIHWTAMSTGVLLLTPLILAVSGHCRSGVPGQRRWELALYTILCVAVLSAILLHQHWPALLPSPLYAIIPLLLWSALRLGTAATAATMLLFAILSLQVTFSGVGPFSGPGRPLYEAMVSTAFFVLLLAVSIHVVGIVVYERHKSLLRLARQYNHDPLTGALTRPPLEQELKSELQRFQRYGEPFCMVMFDLDHFKAVNDDLGHEAGDRVLREAVGLIRAHLRKPDVLARWGGEEFIILLPNTLRGGAETFAERCRVAIEAHDFGIGRWVTVSLGLCEAAPGCTVNDVLRSADHAMYAAKQQGRNRVVAGECHVGVAGANQSVPVAPGAGSASA